MGRKMEEASGAETDQGREANQKKTKNFFMVEMKYGASEDIQ